MIKKLNSHNDSTALQTAKDHFAQQPIEVARWDDHDVDFEILRRKCATDSSFIPPKLKNNIKLDSRPENGKLAELA